MTQFEPCGRFQETESGRSRGEMASRFPRAKGADAVSQLFLHSTIACELSI